MGVVLDRQRRNQSLKLYRSKRDFAQLLKEDAELGKTIESVARERLVQLGMGTKLELGTQPEEASS